MSKYIEYTIRDSSTGYKYETMAKDRSDAIEQVADMYDLDYTNLEVV